MSMSRARLAIAGPPGAGKGTQAKLLSDAFGIQHVSSGELLRAAASGTGALSPIIAHYLEVGALVPDRLLFEVLRDRLRELATSGHGFVLDGYPRTPAQAAVLGQLLVATPLQVVVRLVVPAHVSLIRLSRRGRSDDHQAVVERRLRAYRAETEPMLDRLRSDGLLMSVDGTRPVPDVHRAITLEVPALVRDVAEGVRS